LSCLPEILTYFLRPKFADDELLYSIFVFRKKWNKNKTLFNNDLERNNRMLQNERFKMLIRDMGLLLLVTDLCLWVLTKWIHLNFVMSKWSGPRKILRHRNGSRQQIGHYGEQNLLAKYQFLKRMLTLKHHFTILPLLIS